MDIDGDLFNPARRLPARFADVVQVLRYQIALIRQGAALTDGKLEYFRHAFEMVHFPDVVRLVRHRLGTEIFSTLEEIEAMERDVANNDCVELIVQCCIILYFWERERFNQEMPIPDVRNSPVWLFSHCRSLTEVAFLRSRLRFIHPHLSFVLISIERSLMGAVRDHFEEALAQSSWEGLLLVFRECGPISNQVLFTYLDRALHHESFVMPKAAATLFLSYTSDVIMTLTLLRPSGIRKGTMDKRIIRNLLRLGASLLVSREHHHNLFRSLEPQLRTARNSWWLEVEYPRPHPNATALNRIFTHPWDREFALEVLSRVCCYLDASETIRRRYGVIKVPSLACLAAQKISASALAALGPLQRFMATKHMSLIL